MKYTSLKELLIAGNRLKAESLSMLSALQLLEVLDISENQLHSFPAEAALSLPRLVSLNCSDNRLLHADGIAHMSRLATLDLSDNWLESLPNLAHLALTSVDVSNNPGLSPVQLRYGPSATTVICTILFSLEPV